MATLTHTSLGYPDSSAGEKLVEIMAIILLFSARVVK